MLQTKTYIFADLIEGKKTQTIGGDAVPPLWFHPIFPPPKKSPITTTIKNTLDVFTLSNRNPITGISFNLQAI